MARVLPFFVGMFSLAASLKAMAFLLVACWRGLWLITIGALGYVAFRMLRAHARYTAAKIRRASREHIWSLKQSQGLQAALDAMTQQKRDRSGYRHLPGPSFCEVLPVTPNM